MNFFNGVNNLPILISSNLFVSFIVLTIIFFVIREIATWYWKINRIIDLLEEIADNTRKHKFEAPVVHESVVTPPKPAPETIILEKHILTTEEKQAIIYKHHLNVLKLRKAFIITGLSILIIGEIVFAIQHFR